MFKIENLDDVWKVVSPTKDGLIRLKRKALRFHVWSKILDENSRKFCNLVTVDVDKIKSNFLKRVLAPIIKKILESMKGLGGDLKLMLKSIGLNLAQKIVQIALNWKNFSAIRWMGDLGFIRYLTIMCTCGDGVL